MTEKSYLDYRFFFFIRESWQIMYEYFIPWFTNKLTNTPSATKLSYTPIS